MSSTWMSSAGRLAHSQSCKIRLFIILITSGGIIAYVELIVLLFVGYIKYYYFMNLCAYRCRCRGRGRALASPRLDYGVDREGRHRTSRQSGHRSVFTASPFVLALPSTPSSSPILTALGRGAPLGDGVDLAAMFER
jgi:hypothetical protein